MTLATYVTVHACNGRLVVCIVWAYAGALCLPHRPLDQVGQAVEAVHLAIWSDLLQCMIIELHAIRSSCRLGNVHEA